MKQLPGIRFLALVFLFSGVCWAQEEKPAIPPSMEGWKLKSDEDAKAEMAVVADAWEGKPALRLEIVSAPPEKWWLVSLGSPDFSVEEGVPYVITFWAKVEGPRKSIFLNLGSSGKKISPEKKLAIDGDWQEYTYYFAVDRTASDAHLTIANLAQQGLVVYIANVTLARE